MGLQSRLPIQVPIIHHFDVHNNFTIMEDCGDDIITLRKLLCSGKVSSQKLAENIGAAVGQCIALVHEWSKTNPDGLLNYDRRVATLQHCDKDDLPLLSDLEIPPSDIQTISEIIDEYHTHLMSSRVPGQDVVVMLKIFSSVSNNIPLAPTFWIGSLREQVYQARKSAYFALILNYWDKEVGSPVNQHQQCFEAF